MFRLWGSRSQWRQMWRTDSRRGFLGGILAVASTSLLACNQAPATTPEPAKPTTAPAAPTATTATTAQSTPAAQATSPPKPTEAPKPTVAATAKTTSAPVNLKFFTRGDDTIKKINDLQGAAFNKLNPNITVTTELAPGEFYQKLQLLIHGGTPPDAMFEDNSTIGLSVRKRDPHRPRVVRQVAEGLQPGRLPADPLVHDDLRRQAMGAALGRWRAEPLLQQDPVQAGQVSIRYQRTSSSPGMNWWQFPRSSPST